MISDDKETPFDKLWCTYSHRAHLIQSEETWKRLNGSIFDGNVTSLAKALLQVEYLLVLRAKPGGIPLEEPTPWRVV